MDPKLIVLARAANQGEVCPPINLLLSGGLVIGQPVSPDAFDQPSRRAVEQRVWSGMPEARKGRKEDEKLALYRQAMEPMKPVFDAMAEPDEETLGAALTIADAQWLPPSGDGLRIKALRVPLASISAWWMGAGERISAGSSWSFFFGGIVPVGD